MIFHWPQILFIVFRLAIALIVLAGDTRATRWHWFVIRLAIELLVLFVLYKGGFFLGMTP